MTERLLNQKQMNAVSSDNPTMKDAPPTTQSSQKEYQGSINGHTVRHYENFPVASLLCPAHLRPAVVAIYNFARTADDLADEGEAGDKGECGGLHKTYISAFPLGGVKRSADDEPDRPQGVSRMQSSIGARASPAPPPSLSRCFRTVWICLGGQCRVPVQYEFRQAGNVSGMLLGDVLRLSPVRL